MKFLLLKELTPHRKSEHFPTGLTLMPIANHLANYLACVSFLYEKLRSDTNIRPDRGGGGAATPSDMDGTFRT
jgi:hypothetical protein